MKIKGRTLNFNLLFGVVERVCSLRWLNLWKTLYVNFRSLPFGQAVRLPIVVYGRLRVVSLMGTIEIEGPIKTGMIRLGEMNPGNFKDGVRSKISNNGKIIFKGSVHFFNGFSIFVNPMGTLSLGHICFFGDNVFFHVKNMVKIGDYTRIGDGSRIMDNDIHYIYNLETNSVDRNDKPIIIGRNNWFPAECNIMKGTVTNDNTIVAAKSHLNKDYTQIAPEYSFIAGMPAKLIKTGVRRIFNFATERMLNDYFKHADTPFVFEESIGVDAFANHPADIWRKATDVDMQNTDDGAE